jgi:hypothetical protein
MIPEATPVKGHLLLPNPSAEGTGRSLRWCPPGGGFLDQEKVAILGTDVLGPWDSSRQPVGGRRR